MKKTPVSFIFSILLLLIFFCKAWGEEIPLALTHIDTISVYCNKIKSDHIQVDFLNLDSTLLLSTALWIPKSIDGDKEAMRYVRELLTCLAQKIKGKDNIKILKSSKDIDSIIKGHKIGLIITIEGGEPIEDLNNIVRIKELGIRGISLTWSRDNSLATAHNTDRKTGLTEKGIKAVKMLNENGIMIDVSHASDMTIEDILKYSIAPIYASHSNSRAVCNNNRNLTDDQIKKIVSKGGIIGINFHSPHLSCSSNSTVNDIYLHIKHIRDIAGVEAIAIGSDFDGHIISPKGVEDINGIDLLIKKLREENWTEYEIECILYRNFLRYFKRVVRD